MTTVIEKIQLEPLIKKEHELQPRFYLINGKLRRIDWKVDQRHFFRFLEIISDILKTNVPENLFTDAVLHFLRLNSLLLESHVNDASFNNSDMLSYFLAILDHHTILNGKEIKETNLRRIFKFWGIDEDYDHYLRKISQAKTSLESAKLLKFNHEIDSKELLSKVDQAIIYLHEILPKEQKVFELIYEKVEDLIDKRVIPYADMRDAALTMIVAFFPNYLEIPAINLFTMLHLRKDFNVHLPTLRKRVYRFRERLERYDFINSGK